MIYFDNMASTKVCEESLREQIRIDTEVYGNSTALSKFGADVEKEIVKARNKISQGLKVKSPEIIFTSGATESNNTFILGVAKKYNRLGNHIITQKTEHKSVLQTMKKLENEGFDVTYLDVNDKGMIDLNELKNNLKETTILVSIMHINNETGVIFPIEEITKITKEYNKEIKVFVDGVQSFGKLDLNLVTLGIDGYSFSGHKIHAPKGVGGLFIKSGVNIEPLIVGGGQQNNLRSGTLNTGGVVALATAFEIANKNVKENYENAKIIKKKFLELLDKIDGVEINGDFENSCAYTLNLSFKDLKGEVLLHALADEEIYISTGSSCNSKSDLGMLAHYGYENDRVLGSIRIGISRFSTIEEAEICIEKIEKLVPMLRRFKRR